MKKAIITILCISLLLLAGCTNKITTGESIEFEAEVISLTDDEEKTIDVTVFYEDAFGYIVPVDMQIPWTEGVAKAVIRKMMNTAELQKELLVMGLQSLMPPEAALNGISISSGLAKIDFKTAELTLNSAKDEQNFVNGVVLALTSFPTVKKVQLMFNGKVLDSLPYGTKVGEALTAGEINMASVRTGDEAVSVFYYGISPTNYEYYVPVTAYVQKNDIFSALEYLFSEKQEGLETSIPEGTKLISAGEIGDYYCIFLSNEFNALREKPEDIEPAVKSILLTAAEYTDKEVKLYAGQKEFMPDDGIEYPTFVNVY